MNSNKVILVICSILLLAGSLAGCNSQVEEPGITPEAPLEVDIPTETPAQTADGPFSVVDALGRTVAFEKQPRNIIIAGKATTMLTNAIFLFPEARERVLSYEQRSQSNMDFISIVFEEMAGKTLLAKDSNAEQIAPFQPDLVIFKTYMRDKVGMPVETLGIPVIYLDLETPDQFYADLRTMGQVFGNSAHAEGLIAMYQANETRISEGLAGIEETEKPSVLLLEYKNKGGELTFSVPPVNYLQTVIVERAGGVPVWKEALTDGGWTVVTLEQIAAWDPQIIFIVDYNGTAVEVVTGLKQDPKWQAMRAGQTGKIYAFPSDFLSWDQPDPRWGLGELWLATRIYPEGFPSVDMRTEVRNFYTNYYGLDEKTIDEKILPLLTGDL